MSSLEILITGTRRAEAVPQSRPAVPAGQVLVRTIKSLVSPGTELSFFEGTHIGLPDLLNSWAKYPFRPGYATIGEVVETGEGVSAPAVGSRIFFFGFHAHWNLLPQERVWLETPDLDDDAVLLSRLVQIAATGVEVLRRPPQSAVVIGAGLIGLFAAQTLQARGCEKVVVQDVLASRLELARRNGLANAVLGEGLNVDAVQKFLGTEQPDCVIEATGLAAMAGPALKLVHSSGDVVLLGIPRGETTLNLYNLIVRKNAALIGAHEGMIPDRAAPGITSRQGLVEEAIAGMQRGSIRVEGLISGHFRPEDCQKFYDQLSNDKANCITAVIDWC